MKDKPAERRMFRVEEMADDESWPAQIVLDGVAVAWFANRELASEVSATLNEKYFPSRLDRASQIIAVLNSAGTNLLNKPPVPSFDMPEGA